MKKYFFYEKLPKKNSRFIALYADRSGADLFMRDKDGIFCDTQGGILSQTWFTDSGYLDYAYLNANDRLWFEVKDELPDCLK